MKTTMEALEGNKVKLSVSVEEDEFEQALDDAFRRIAREVRIPGFRPGRAPRKVLEARIGKGVAREEALREALPGYYAQAVRDHEVDAIAAPEIDITDGQESGPVSFDAVVETRPQVTVGGYESLRVTIPSPEPTDEERQEQLDRLREPFGSLEAVGRPAQDGDHVLVDIAGSQAGEPLDGLTADDYSYELGSEAIVPEIDENLRGAKPGDILEFDAGHPDPDEDELHFRVLVKEVQQRVLPEVTDEWASEASEFDTADELRADLEQRLRTIKVAQAQMFLQQRTAEALGDLVDDELPESLIEHEMQHRLQDLVMRLHAQGADLEQYLAATGTSVEELTSQLREAAGPAVRVDLALRAVAEAEGIEATDEDLADELAVVAERTGRDADEIRAELERGGQMPEIRSDIRKRKAIEWLVGVVEIVDDAGEPIDRASLEITTGADEDIGSADDSDADESDADDTDAGVDQEAQEEEEDAE